MTKSKKIALFALGTLLMSVPGLITEKMGWAFLVLLIVGYIILIVATVKNGGSRPVTALALLITSNVAFWLSYGLWLIRLKFVGPSPESGIDPFAGPLAIWV